jgi:hypothetical protein
MRNTSRLADNDGNYIYYFVAAVVWPTRASPLLAASALFSAATLFLRNGWLLRADSIRVGLQTDTKRSTSVSSYPRPRSSTG